MYTQFQSGKQVNFLASEKFTAFPETINSTNYNVQTDDLGRKYVPETSSDPGTPRPMRWKIPPWASSR